MTLPQGLAPNPFGYAFPAEAVALWLRTAAVAAAALLGIGAQGGAGVRPPPNAQRAMVPRLSGRSLPGGKFGTFGRYGNWDTHTKVCIPAEGRDITFK